MSLHVNEANISDLWRLDTHGIQDPGGKGIRKELEAATKESFYVDNCVTSINDKNLRGLF